MEKNQRIHVSVRARPLSPDDAKTSPWRIAGNSIFISHQSSQFEFDQVFGEESKTEEVYEARTKDIVAAAVRGFNGTVFAYGQTNSGKTYTMRGSAAEPGVIPLAVRDLFATIQEEEDREFLLRMSYMEIYNEEINDLLAPEHRKLQIHESLERGIFVAGLREEIVASPEQVLQLMEFGESHRHIGETNMNLHSSRSHTIFRMIIESRDRRENDDTDNSCDAVRVSVLNLVDLAGSERAAKTGAEGVRLKEGSHINKSLMTLGTVIKKLSEGAESQGSHVPYRDSKLTRILQPALGGNANTAIICNITLAHIHSDETKSSLQFASRALHVTNCVHVNEILTDAALLKRQKKEIEELRAKLQGSHSEHLEEEILNLRNTLLKTELERERMAAQWEAEKKERAEHEKKMAKKIENLSSMVFCSTRDETRDHQKKEKRRDTWCPGKLSQETLRELHSAVNKRASALKSRTAESDVGPLIPFEELVNEEALPYSRKEDEVCKNNALEDCTLPDPRALLHVTSRRKASIRKKSLPLNNALGQMQAEYEDLLQEFETQKTISVIQIDCLTRKLAEAGVHSDTRSKDGIYVAECTVQGNTTKSLREPESILVKQHQDKLCEEILSAWEEARAANEQLNSMVFERVSNEESCIGQLLAEVQEISSEVQNSRNYAETISSFMEELFQSFSVILNLFTDHRSSFQNQIEIKSIFGDYEKLETCMMQKIKELENEKLHLFNQLVEFQNQIQEYSLEHQNSAKKLSELSEQCETEKSEFLSQIQVLQKELSCLSYSSLAREKETMRKDLEKTKAKLKETEFKLRNVIQEKTKIEGEKACAEREIKHLHGQKAILERDISKRDSVAGRKHDSVIDRRSSVFELKRAKGLSVSMEKTLEDDYKKLEVLAFEMETTIASLEEELALAREERGQAVFRTESLTSELQEISDKLVMSNSELDILREQVLSLKSSLAESYNNNEKLKSSITMLAEEKEELAMQLTEALLAMEEEKAIWSAKEKASLEAIEEKTKSYDVQLSSLSNKMSEVINELKSCKEECKVLGERLALSEETVEVEKKCRSTMALMLLHQHPTLATSLGCGYSPHPPTSHPKKTKEKLFETGSAGNDIFIVIWSSLEMSLENERLRDGLRLANDQNKRSQDILNSKLEMLSSEHRHTCEEVNKLLMEQSMLTEEKENFLAELLKLKTEVNELTWRSSSLEAKMHNDNVKSNIEKAKLRMMLRGTQAKVDNFRLRYKEVIDERDLMDISYKEASSKLKNQLANCGLEILNLKKELAALKRT